MFPTFSEEGESTWVTMRQSRCTGLCVRVYAVVVFLMGGGGLCEADSRKV